MANDVLWRRLRYFLSPQLDLYQRMRTWVVDRKVLEVGFGSGVGAVQLGWMAEHVMAIEPDKDAVDFAMAAFPHPNISWVEASILDEPNTIDYFGVVTLVEVLEHIKDWELALRNIHACLVDDGFLIMTARNANADLRRNQLHEREWTAKELVENLEKYFARVELYDHTLTVKLPITTTQTPLIAVAYKE